MALIPGEDIGEETHPTHEQLFRVEQGQGHIVIDGATHQIKGGDAIVVPCGARQNLRNSGDEPLKVYTLYGPPNHTEHLVHVAKATAEASSEQFDGAPTE